MFSLDTWTLALHFLKMLYSQLHIIEVCIFLCRIARHFFSAGDSEEKDLGNTMPWWNLCPKNFTTCDECGRFTLRLWHLWNVPSSAWRWVCDVTPSPWTRKIRKTDDAFTDESLEFSEFSYGYDDNQMCGCLFLFENVIDCSIWLICSPRRVDKNLSFFFLGDLQNVDLNNKKVAHLLFLWQWTINQHFAVYSQSQKPPGFFSMPLLITLGWPRRDTRTRQVERSRIGACFVETSHPSAGGGLHGYMYIHTSSKLLDSDVASEMTFH